MSQRKGSLGRVVVIYVLLDALGSRRYVGKTIDPAARLRTHRKRKFPWASKLEALETCGEESWEGRERFWIAHGRAEGWPLENVAAGGNAVPSTAEVRAKIAA